MEKSDITKHIGNKFQKYRLKNNLTQNQVAELTGTNDTTKYTETQDIQCNIYDMASNVIEWTTETFSGSGSACVRRGDYYNGSSLCTSYRDYISTSYGYDNTGFRPLLYLQVLNSKAAS